MTHPSQAMSQETDLITRFRQAPHGRRTGIILPPAMDIPPAWSRACMCRQTFFAPHTYTYHMHTCPQTKKRLSSALGKAREVFQVKKRRKMEVMIRQEASETSNHPVVNDQQVRFSPSTHPAFLMRFIRSLRQLA